MRRKDLTSFSYRPWRSIISLLPRLREKRVYVLMNIIGLSAFYHESACCLLQEGRLVGAVSEERFSRVKYDPRLPVQAFRYCLQAGKISLPDVDCVAYYESPVKKLSRQLWAGLPDGDAYLSWLDPHQAERAIRERLGYDGPILFFDHHHAHAVP